MPTTDASLSEPTRPAAPRGRTVLGNLSLLTVGLLVPIAIFVAFLLWRFAESERTRLERETGDIAQSIAVSLDQELSGIFSSLEILATSPALLAGDFDAFRTQAQAVLDRLGIVTVVTDGSGQQLLNMRVPEGAPLPRSDLHVPADRLASGIPFVSDLIVGQVTGTRQFLAVKSVGRPGRAPYVVFFSIALDRLQRILQAADVTPGYTASIVDRAGTIMALNARPEDFVGRKATDDLLANTTGRRGSWAGRTADGREVFAYYVRSNLSDFRAVAGVPYADLNRPIWRSLSLFALLGIALAALSTVLGLLFARRIAGPVGRIARQAALLGRGEPLQPLHTGLVEVDQVGADMATASESLREREHDLREANDEIQRFAYIVSHDLRSPLVNIMGFTTELEALRSDVFARLDALKGGAEGGAERDEELAQDFDEALGFIKASIGKMDRLINAILHLSRQGRREFKPERIDVDALVAGIVASMAHQAESAGATVTVGRLPPALSDRLALEQVLSNLVDNALKYLRRDVPGTVSVTGSVGKRNVVYAVSDNGRGIEPKDRERVFDLFRRSGVQDRPGEGIGLAHVRTLVRRLGGSIVLTSEPGQGSTFTVTLPRRWAGRQREAA